LAMSTSASADLFVVDPIGRLGQAQRIRELV
jgi:hypothetical protein